MGTCRMTILTLNFSSEMYYFFVVCFGETRDKTEAVNMKLHSAWAESMHKLKGNSTDTYFTHTFTQEYLACETVV